jgi:hypothetical protein
MEKLLKKISLLNKDGTLSVTNSVVLIFVIITALRTLFVGIHISLQGFNWKIDEMDLSATLPLLFSLINYGHKRKESNKFLNQNIKEENNVKENKTNSN